MTGKGARMLAVEGTKPVQPRRIASSRSPHAWVVFVVGLVAFRLCVLASPLLGPADITDGDLEAASSGTTVRVGALSGGGGVATMPLEVYVARVLAGEGESRAADIAYQALAVAIRTYALANTGRHGRDGFDLCDTTHCQVPRVATPIARRAALSTAGQILTYRGEVATVFYSASCGGHSESPSAVWPGTDYPYLLSVPDEVHEDDDPWTVELTLRDIQQALERAGFAGRRLRDVRVDARSGSGRVTRLRLTGLQPQVVAGEPFRAAIGTRTLRSTAFSIRKRGDSLEFTGSGYGHGVGLCVIGAGRRASRGDSVRAILSHYYPGLELASLNGLPEALPPPAPAPAPPAAARVRAPRAVVHAPFGSSVSTADLEQIVTRAHDELSKRLGTSVEPITVLLHGSLESFRLATGQPWWVNSVTDATSIDLGPAALLARGDELEVTVRTAIAELFVSDALADRPAWVRVGAARYFGRQTTRRELPAPARCPADAELMLAISAAAQGNAETRAEACFARAYAETGDWRSVGR